VHSSRREGWGKQTDQQYGLTLFQWNQWKKVERLLLKWLKSWTSNTETVLCSCYCFTVGACCSLWLYFSRSKRSILKEFNSGLLLLTYFLHTMFVAVRTLNWLQCLAAAPVTSRCHSTFCSVTLHSKLCHGSGNLNNHPVCTGMVSIPRQPCYGFVVCRVALDTKYFSLAVSIPFHECTVFISLFMMLYNFINWKCL